MIAHAVTRNDNDGLMEIIRAGSRDMRFAELVKHCGGLHPIELLERLDAILLRGGEEGAMVSLLSQDARRSEKTSVLDQGQGLPLPHPLDAEWRFTVDCANALLDTVVAATSDEDAILLLGVPSVALAALQSSYARRFVIVGEHNVVSRALDGLTARDPRFRHEGVRLFAAAVLDPPWYDYPYRSMLARAAAACASGAVVLATAPSDGVRPGVARERDAYLAAAREMGLEVTHYEPEQVRYRTPAFELAAMRAAGVGAWLPAWRTGDFVSFKKRDQLVVPLGGADPEEALPAIEVTLQGVRVRLLASGRGEASLKPVARSEVFPSVSVRTPGRAEANLWTTGNRAFCVDPGTCLRAMLSLCAREGLWQDGLSSDQKQIDGGPAVDKINRLTEELANLIRLEIVESEALVGGSAWERSLSDARYLRGSSTEFLARACGGA